MTGWRKMKSVKVRVTSPEIRLDQFLKWAGAVPTGGHAKALIQEGHVRVNGRQELRRGRKVHTGDLVAVAGVGGEGQEQTYEVARDEGDGP